MEIGDKVLCVGKFNLDDREIKAGVKAPIIGNEYTIRAFRNYGDFPTIQVNEIINPPLQYGQGFLECAFNRSKFIKWNLEEETIEIKEKVEVTV